MAKGELIDYYGILNLPPRADLMGVENAYARISDDLAKQMAVDEGAKIALNRANEAYSVLSKPELRREYDRVFFSRELAAAQKISDAALRRKLLKERILIGALGLIVAGQGGILAYVSWDRISSIF
ncbi:MAG: DnaJ domain-containing protein [Tepidiformaceae bacterium]